MNAVEIEIEEAVSQLAERAFDPGEFAFEFLEALGKKGVTFKRLRAGATNKSDVGGVLTLSEQDDCDYDEVRERAFGLLPGVVVVCVINALRDDRIGIISARRATKREQALYDDHY